MKRDFRKELEHEKCWDAEVDRVFAQTQRHPFECLLQNREELILFCEWIEYEKISSYLEIGIWTGHLISLLHKLFQFEKLGACDLLQLQQKLNVPVNVPPETELFVGFSNSLEYMDWRKNFGDVDLVFIDGDHAYDCVLQDFLINSKFRQKFIAFHDIESDSVRRVWEQITGDKLEIVRKNLETDVPRSGMGIGIWRASK